MKILFVSPTGAFFSGAEVAIVNLMIYLSQHGHEIYNIIPDNGDYTDQSYLEVMKNANIDLYRLPYNQWWWKESAIREKCEQTGIIAFQHRNVWDVRQIIKNAQIDLVISNTINVFQGALAAACEGIPHYYIIHEFPDGEFDYYKEKIDLITNLSEKLFIVEGQLFETLKNYFPLEKMIPFMPYTALDEYQVIQGNQTRIVSIGGITERKNQLELIKAYHKLNRPDIELLFIGGWDNVYKEKCDAYIAHHSLTNISFLGHQKNPWLLVADKDIVVFTSRMEAFPLVYVESILSGVPTIVSDNGGHLSVHNKFEAGLVYQLGDTDALASSITTILKQFSTYRERALKKQKQVQKLYTLSEAVAPFLDNLQPVSISTFKETFSKLQTFFSLNLSNEQLEQLKWDNVTVFFGDQEGQFSSENVIKYSLEEKGCLELLVTNEPVLRIDLSEFPGAFRDIKLISTVHNIELEPFFTNALLDGDDVLFFDRDPQLIYDVRQYSNETLLFSYRRLESVELTKKMKLLLDKQMQGLSQKELEHQQLIQEYQIVVTSQRWKMATALVTFLNKLGINKLRCFIGSVVKR